MASFNKVILMGNLTRDPEIRVTSSGMSIAKLGLAVNRRYSTKDGEQREEVTFVDIDAFGRQAEVLGKYAQKGRALLVEGRLKLDQWETQQGEKRSKLNVVLENFQFGDSRSGGEGGGSNYSEDDSGGDRGYERSSPPQRERQSSSRQEEDLDEDVPF